MSENYQRNASDSGSEPTDFDYFITTELPLQQIHNMLTLQKKSEDEIEKMLEKVKETRDKIRKSVRKFVRKVESYYGHLDLPELIKKGLKHAAKHGHSEVEKKVFINHVLKGDVHNEFTLMGETKFSPMAKFLGYSDQRGQMLRLEAKDHSKLNELKMMYDQTLILHANVKNQMFNYRDCAAEALTGSYDRTKHDVNVSIHPIIAMLFLPKVDYIEKRMLYTNIARMVLSRGQAYLRSTNFHLQSGVAPGELDAEFELAHDIAYDPNSLEHFMDHTPITNIIKRYRCQIELYKSVLNLRQGRYYSVGYGQDDGISGFLRVINEQDWTFFDSPDLYHVQDEGTILRKLLAVFSVRPTFTQLTSFGQRYGLGYTNVTNMAKTRLMNIPIVNIKLPLDLTGSTVPQSISLARALNQTDTFIEHRTIVPKNKSVIYSNQVCFFYANRKYQAVNFTALDCTLSMRHMALPTPVMNTTKTNTTQIVFDDNMRIGRDWFAIRSVCVLQRPPLNGLDIPTGSSALVRYDDGTGSANCTSFFHYNPSGASIQFYDQSLAAGNTQYRSNDPITYIPEYDPSPNGMGFKNEAQERGIVFFYTKH
jgi:hypothetical protein